MDISDAKRSEVGHTAKRGIVGPIYIGDLNQQFMASGVFVITETIALDENGAAVVTRRNEPCALTVSQSAYQSYIDGLRKRFPEVRTLQPGFEAGHRFLPSHLMKHAAKTLGGETLPSREVAIFGSTEIKVALPVEVRFEEGMAHLCLPGYILEVEISQLARRLEGTWFLQWSHGSIGRGKFRLELIIPNLRTRLWKWCFYNQFFSTTPDYQTASFVRPLHRWFAAVCRRLLGVGVKASSGDLTELCGSESPESGKKCLTHRKAMRWPRLEPKRFTYIWEHVLRTPETFSIHVNYGVRYRKRLFSPLGLLASTILAVILTVLLAEPIAKILRFLHHAFVE